ncbi:hypothetical protein [Caminibacter sp.]
MNEELLKYLLVILPYLIALFGGIFLVLLFFKISEKKNEKIWTNDLKKILKEKEIETDKELHEKILIRESYINSIERLRKFLINIYKKRNEVFHLTPLDAYMLIEIFPFDIRKSKDGKYYLINKNDFIMFLKLLVNKNHTFISDEKILEIRDKIVKKLLSFDERQIVIDAKYVFDLIRNTQIPNPNIEDQNFIKLTTAFDEDVLFKIEEPEVYEKEYKTKKEKIDKKNKHKDKDVSIIKGKEHDYMIDLKTGIQYVINKNKNSDNKKEKNKDVNDRLSKLIENLTILIASQPQQISQSIKEVIAEIKTKSDINEDKLKSIIEKDIIEKMDETDGNENIKEIKKNTQTLLNEILGEMPNITGAENKNVLNENKTDNLDQSLDESLNTENKENKSNVHNIIADGQKDKNEKPKQNPKDGLKDKNISKENEALNKNEAETVLAAEENVEGNVSVPENNNVQTSLESLYEMSDDSFLNDFGINGNEDNTFQAQMNEEQKSDRLFFFFKEIENGELEIDKDKKEKIKTLLFEEVNEIYFAKFNRAYFILLEDFIKILYEVETDKIEAKIDIKLNEFIKEKSDDELFRIFSRLIENIEFFKGILETNNRKFYIKIFLGKEFINKFKEKNLIKIIKYNEVKKEEHKG